MNKFLTIAFLSMAYGCANRSEQASAAMGSFDGGASKISSPQESTPPPIQERMLIKTGQLNMKVEDVKKARNKIERIAQTLNAYLSEERLDDSGDRLTVSMTVRIPANLYDSLVVLVEKIGLKTENKSVNTQDVTEEFIDTEARLKTKKELETRYREILKQANSVTDILSVENQLNNVRGEIESMEGRLKYLSSQVLFSTLNLSFYQSLTSDFGFANQLFDGLKNGWLNLLSFLIGLINIWPFVLLIGGGAWIFIRWKRLGKS